MTGEGARRKIRRIAVFGFLVLLLLGTEQVGAQGNATIGAEIFKAQNCPECHGNGGKGDGYILSILKVEVKMRNWTDTTAMAGLTDEYLADVVAKGGEALGKSDVMLSYADKLSPEQIQNLVAYIRSLAK